MADYPLEKLLRRKIRVVNALRKAFDDPEYARAVTVGTGSPKAVELRLNLTREILEKALR